MEKWLTRELQLNQEHEEMYEVFCTRLGDNKGFRLRSFRLNNGEVQ